jgi:hypothetical protein
MDQLAPGVGGLVINIGKGYAAKAAVLTEVENCTHDAGNAKLFDQRGAAIQPQSDFCPWLLACHDWLHQTQTVSAANNRYTQMKCIRTAKCIVLEVFRKVEERFSALVRLMSLLL